ncbi:hypothetical protein RBG61_05610 [Paludicola sp. MB14-C6]|uniref:ECF transporter S component n=1 Tax=Paludihabitans sp. MB14-C6 TaxID=3070656 RepID=UPI0027DCF9FA|nr:ECF transporter S component [Paludicola sp. MB14-C6]WMJ24141.1 hypothetical protein RBG61_05610 [Paludicola sp. MB14-C6]
MKSNVLWIVKTAIFLAALVVLQAITKPFGPIVTGSAVNFVLIATTLTVGMGSGLIVACVSPFLAFFLQVVPLPIFFVPVIALGNAVLVVIYALILKKAVNKSTGAKLFVWIIAIVASSALKFITLYGGVNWAVIPMMTAIKGAAVKAPAAIFSTTQMITAAIGGVLATLVVPPILKAIKNKKY